MTQHPSLLCYSGDTRNGVLTRLEKGPDQWQAMPLSMAESTGKDVFHSPIFIAADADQGISLLDPEQSLLRQQAECPADAFPLYGYPDHAQQGMWYTHDGDRAAGVDPVSGGENGAAVTVMQRDAAGRIRHLKTLQVGRGHHVVCQVAPTDNRPNMPRLTFVSNLLNGTVYVYANEPGQGDYLQQIATIDLGRADKEKGTIEAMQNNAFPHGMVYSPLTGRVYCLSNGYQAVAVINPVSRVLEGWLDLPGCSNILLHPSGRYLMGKGADRKADAEHVQGCLTVLDVVSGACVDTHTLTDIYPSTYRFSPDGGRLYVTTSATGKGVQRANLDTSSLLVFDTSELPAMQALPAVQVGRAECSRRPFAYLLEGSHQGELIIPNLSEGTVSIVDAGSLCVTQTVVLGVAGASEFAFSLWDKRLYGC